MTVLVLGGTGATGRLLVRELLGRDARVRVVVRSAGRLPADVLSHPNLSVTEAAVLDLSDEGLAELVAGCDAVASCLGHNLSLRGVFGPPRRLVTRATARLCSAIRANNPPSPVRFVLMSSAGVRNRELNEPVSTGQRLVVGLLRLLVPPHADNEQAAEVLRRVDRDDPLLRWAVVRPDTLIDADAVSPYELHPSPTRSAIFNPGKTSRVNVAHVMAELIADEAFWANWEGQMPVVYNRPG